MFDAVMASSCCCSGKIKKARSLEPIDEVLSDDIPALLKMIPRERDAKELPDIFRGGIANVFSTISVLF